MDKEYIKLCAELAYNDVIIESVLLEDSDDNSILDKIKSFFEMIKKVISSVANKIQTFIMDKVKEFKKKVEQINIKHAEIKHANIQHANIQHADIKYTNHESTDILNESIDYAKVMHDFYNDVIENKLIKSEKEHLSKLRSCVSEIDKWFEKGKTDTNEFGETRAIYNIESSAKKFVENADEDIKDCSKESISKEFNNTIMDKIDSDKERSNLPTNTALNLCIDIAKRHEKSVKEYISVIDESKKNIERKFRDASKGIKAKYNKAEIAYYRSLKDIYTKSSNCLNKLQSGYAQAAVLMFKTIPSTFSA